MNHGKTIVIGSLLLALGLAASGQPLQLFGFGPSLVVSDGPFYRTSLPVIPATAADDASFLQVWDPIPYPADPTHASRPLTYDSFQNQLSNHTRDRSFWIRFGLRNTSDSVIPLNIDYGTIDYADAWLISPGHKPLHISGGYLRSSISGSTVIQRQYYTLPFALLPRQAGEIVIELRQKTRGYYFDGISVFSSDALATVFANNYEKDHSSIVFQWLFQGFLLFQILYMLFQWLIIRRKEYLYYLFYIAVIALYFLSKFELDLGFNLLFARYPILGVYLGKTMMILAYFLYYRFVRHFLEIGVNYPRLNQWLIRIEYFLLIYGAADLAFILLTMDDRTQTTVFTVVLLFIFLSAATIIFYLFRRRQALISYVLTGSLFVAVGNIFGLIITGMRNYHPVDLGFNILIVPQVGVLLEMLCFTAGLGYKSHMWEKEKIRNQEKLIEQLKANELLQNRMQTIRNKIAQDLHDDIGSTLSSISILSDLAMRGLGGSASPGSSGGPGDSASPGGPGGSAGPGSDADNGSGSSAQPDNEQTNRTMHEIKDSALLLMERMDDIVWSINPRNDSLDNLLMRVRHFATTVFEAKGIDYTIDIPRNISELRLPMDYRQHIYLILKEAINNLVKYAGASLAVIEVRWEGKWLNLCVRDNGKGFVLGIAAAESGTIREGNGLVGMRRRAGLMEAALNIRSAPGEGTEITLRVAVG